MLVLLFFEREREREFPAFTATRRDRGSHRL